MLKILKTHVKRNNMPVRSAGTPKEKIEDETLLPFYIMAAVGKYGSKKQSHIPLL
jgi:hypothetical protein